ncbi:MAG: CDP-alcohol phosphatidyltransferase family protein [Muribaculaceae bacterium]|nr:CDP-alcohol phosphatidyltransferase family protein [Muribaculaceae bacterium]
MFEKLKAEYRSSLKSLETEEHIDLFFFRPLGFLWACLFRKLHVTPNAVTIASIFIGIAGGICFYPTNIWINIIGILLLIWAGVYDCTDGMLARLTGQHSQLGRFLDGISGDFWFIAIYIAFCLRTNNTIAFFGENPWLIWLIALAAGACHTVQAAIADRYRQFHLFFINGPKGSELDSAQELIDRYNALSWRHDFFNKLYLLLYSNYTTTQERLTPTMQELRGIFLAKYGNNALPADKAEEFRKLSFPMCKWENFMTFNWRAIFLYIALLIGYPWLYFVLELTIFNIVLIYTISYHEKICRIMKENVTTY